MSCCAIAPCGDPECSVCSVNTRFKVEPCVNTRCRFIFGHRGPCDEEKNAGKVERADLKESKPVPDLSGPRAPAISLGRKKRSREGPVRQQRG